MRATRHHLTDTSEYRILLGMTYQLVSETRREAEAVAFAWLERRLRFEAWLERVRERPGPQPGSGLAAAA